jgi:hypothetical protein
MNHIHQHCRFTCHMALQAHKSWIPNVQHGGSLGRKDVIPDRVGGFPFPTTLYSLQIRPARSRKVLLACLRQPTSSTLVAVHAAPLNCQQIRFPAL